MEQKRQQADEEASELVESPRLHLGDCIWGKPWEGCAWPERHPPACEESSFSSYITNEGTTMAQLVKNPSANAGDRGSKISRHGVPGTR